MGTLLKMRCVPYRIIFQKEVCDMAYTLKDNYDALCEKLASRNVDIEWVKNK